VIVGADIAAEQKQIRRLILQVFQQQMDRIVTEAIVSEVQVGGDGDAHVGPAG
jgi:hypothetical protein